MARVFLTLSALCILLIYMYVDKLQEKFAKLAKVCVHILKIDVARIPEFVQESNDDIF